MSEKQYFASLNDYWVKDAEAADFIDLDLCAGKHIVMLGDSNAARAVNRGATADSWGDGSGYLFDALKEIMPKATFKGYAIGGAGFVAQSVNYNFDTNIAAQIDKLNKDVSANVNLTPDIIFIWAGGNDITRYGRGAAVAGPIDLVGTQIKGELKPVNELSLEDGEPEGDEKDAWITGYRDVFYQADYAIQQLRKLYPKAQICGVIRTYKRGMVLRGRQEYFYGMLSRIYQKNQCSVINLNDFSQITQLEEQTDTEDTTTDSRIQGEAWSDLLHYSEASFKGIIRDIFYQALKNNLNINTFIPLDEIYQTRASSASGRTRSAFQDGVSTAGTKLLRTSSDYSIISGGRVLSEAFKNDYLDYQDTITHPSEDPDFETEDLEGSSEPEDESQEAASTKKPYISRDEYAWMRMATRQPNVTYAYGELDTGDFLMLEQIREAQAAYVQRRAKEERLYIDADLAKKQEEVENFCKKFGFPVDDNWHSVAAALDRDKECYYVDLDKIGTRLTDICSASDPSGQLSIAKNAANTEIYFSFGQDRYVPIDWPSNGLWLQFTDENTVQVYYFGADAADYQNETISNQEADWGTEINAKLCTSIPLYELFYLYNISQQIAQQEETSAATGGEEEEQKVTSSNFLNDLLDNNSQINTYKDYLWDVASIWNKFKTVCSSLKKLGEENSDGKLEFPTYEDLELPSEQRALIWNNFLELGRTYSFYAENTNKLTLTPDLSTLVGSEDIVIGTYGEDQYETWKKDWERIYSFYTDKWAFSSQDGYSHFIREDFGQCDSFERLYNCFVSNYQNTIQSMISQNFIYGRKGSSRSARIVTAHSPQPLSLKQTNKFVWLQDVKDLGAGIYMITINRLGQYTGLPEDLAKNWPVATETTVTTEGESQTQLSYLNGQPHLKANTGCILTIYMNSSGYKWATLMATGGRYWFGTASRKAADRTETGAYVTTYNAFTWHRISSTPTNTLQSYLVKGEKTAQKVDTVIAQSENSYTTEPVYILYHDQQYYLTSTFGGTKYYFDGQCDTTNNCLKVTTNISQAQLVTAHQACGAYRLYFQGLDNEGKIKTYRISTTSGTGTSVSTNLVINATGTNGLTTLISYLNGQFISGDSYLTLCFDDQNDVMGMKFITPAVSGTTMSPSGTYDCPVIAESIIQSSF